LNGAVPLSRADLLRLLTEACELEHGLACSYLYAAMSLRQEPAGRRLPADKLALVRQWAAQVYFIASQEMLHLAQAWNLLTAIGGTPYYLRPNFPQNSRYYPLHLRLALEPYGDASLRRFIAYEMPASLSADHVFVASLAKPHAADRSRGFKTIGELYQTIRAGLAEVPNAFIGNPADQVGPDLIDFPDIVRVVDLASAQRAIDRVTHQGEGNRTDRADCHFGIFMALYRALQIEKKRNPRFSPAYPAMTNPSTNVSEEYGAPHAHLIARDVARSIAHVFDALYSLMLRMLGYTFTPGGDSALRRAFGQSAIVLMATGLKPLGELLAQTPAKKSAGGPHAGAPFGLTRHVCLPGDAAAARALVSERLAELKGEIAGLAAAAPGLARIDAALSRLPGLIVG
jgi:hypothetical protein